MGETRYTADVRLYAAGHRVTDIARITGRTVQAVDQSLRLAERRGLIERRGFTRLGTISDAVAVLPEETLAWLRSITPPGAKIAHTIAAIVKDAHAEETGAA